MPEEKTAKKSTENEKEEKEKSDASEAMMKMMRMQYGLLMGGAKALTGMAKLTESFLDSFGDKTQVTDSSLSEFLEKLPEGLASATKTTLDEADDLPQEMVDAYRRYSKV